MIEINPTKINIKNELISNLISSLYFKHYPSKTLNKVYEEIAYSNRMDIRDDKLQQQLIGFYAIHRRLYSYPTYPSRIQLLTQIYRSEHLLPNPI